MALLAHLWFECSLLAGIIYTYQCAITITFCIWIQVSMAAVAISITRLPCNSCSSLSGSDFHLRFHLLSYGFHALRVGGQADMRLLYPRVVPARPSIEVDKVLPR